MKVMKQVDVLIFTTAQGHDSLAKVMAREIKEKTNYSVEIMKHDPSFPIHKFLHRYFTWLMRALSKPLNNPRLVPLSRKLSSYKFKLLVEKELKKFKPKVVISTFFLLNPAIENAKERYGFHFINHITDPRTMIALNPSPEIGVNYAFDKTQIGTIEETYPDSKNKVVGWFVDSDFEEDYNKEEVKKELDLDPNLPVLLLTSGSLGNASPAQLLPKFLLGKQRAQLVMICGTNKFLKDMVENFQKAFDQNPNVSLRVVGFTKKMAKYMQAADLVIGKSGPNTLFETVATQTPFMAINYGGPQEKGNLEIIEEYNLGFVEIQPGKVWDRFKELLSNPSLFDSFNSSLKKMKKHNSLAKKELISDVKKAMKA
jgi:UDP-N-acetylglucosamine:LPS N-acetylglucosamine transferase